MLGGGYSSRVKWALTGVVDCAASHQRLAVQSKDVGYHAALKARSRVKYVLIKRISKRSNW